MAEEKKAVTKPTKKVGASGEAPVRKKKKRKLSPEEIAERRKARKVKAAQEGGAQPKKAKPVPPQPKDLAPTVPKRPPVKEEQIPVNGKREAEVKELSDAAKAEIRALNPHVISRTYDGKFVVKYSDNSKDIF